MKLKKPLSNIYGDSYSKHINFNGQYIWFNLIYYKKIFFSEYTKIDDTVIEAITQMCVRERSPNLSRTFESDEVELMRSRLSLSRGTI